MFNLARVALLLFKNIFAQDLSSRRTVQTVVAS